MVEVYPHLYVGSQNDVLDLMGQTTIINHVLTLEIKPLPTDVQKNFSYKFVRAVDEEEFNLLEELEDCLQFIEEGTGGNNNVLVHCAAGQSRSAAAAAAYIMRKHQLSAEEALNKIKEKKPDVGPNYGFMKQLQLFHDMGWKVDKSSSVYRMFKLEMLAESIQAAQMVDRDAVKSLILDSDVSSSHEAVYKCKKCRRMLFSDSVILQHNQGRGAATFDPRYASALKSSSSHDNSSLHDSSSSREAGAVRQQCNMSLFIQPVQWMAEDILHIEGKLNCPKCAAKLGSFKWIGERCPCGTWLCPAFHIQTSKVDKMKQSQIKPPPINS